MTDKSKKEKGKAAAPKSKGKNASDIASQLGGKQKPVDVLTHPSYKALEEKLTKAEQKSHENWDKLLRAKAEFENLQRRVDRDIANAHKYGVEKLVEDLFPVLDSLERGIDGQQPDANADEMLKSVCEGVKLTTDMLLKTLEKFGVKQINPLGEPFNPELHEAMTMQDDKKAKPNTVLKVMQKGYLIYSRLIRPALVVVSKG